MSDIHAADMREAALHANTPRDLRPVFAAVYVGDQLGRIADRLNDITEVRSTALGGREGHVRTRGT